MIDPLSLVSVSVALDGKRPVTAKLFCMVVVNRPGSALGQAQK